MPSIFGLLHCPLEQFIYLKRKFISCIFGRPTQDRLGDDELNIGFTSAATQAGSGSHTVNVLDEPHFPTPPLTSPTAVYLQSPGSHKRKALLVGVDHKNELQSGPHKDIWDMRQFLIGRFKFMID